ncbi:hypothetical protein Q8A70_13335 [Rhodospirillaceae bacterium R-7]|uniref:Uncharacterized protein n=1 Tax=Dongia sedimenti TaxID=3064282 RepID=A0ABU0YLQ0_9PROT|nr:hypothetical protein [Rhodospirillaceae bacterium R-7]
MALKTRKFDVPKVLETERDIAICLSETLETGDTATVAHALGAAARHGEGGAPEQVQARKPHQGTQRQRQSGTGDCIAGSEGAGPGACSAARGADEGCETEEGEARFGAATLNLEAGEILL